MSLSRTLQKAKSFSQRRPLLFNSIIYGTFYTGAEFAQQTYTRVYKLSGPIAENFEDSLAVVSPIPNNLEKRPNVDWINKFNVAVSLMDPNEPAQSNYNWAQLKRYAIYGCLLAGPVLHGWYKWLDTFFRGKSMKIVLVKLVADQFVLTPPLIMMFFISMSLMEGKSNVLGECKAKFVHTFKTSCMYWLPVQFLNFLLIPSTMRVSFVSIAAFCWVNILCYLKSVPLPEGDKTKTNY